MDAIDRTIESVNKKGIFSSRGFSHGVSDLYTLKNAITLYARTAVKKLQDQGPEATVVTVFVQTHRYKKDYYNNSMTLRLPSPTAYLPDIIGPAMEGLQAIFIEGISYAKVGIYLSGIDGGDRYQRDFFNLGKEKKRKLSDTIYRMQKRYGKDVIICGGNLNNDNCRMRRTMLSGCYTTKWEDLPSVE